MTRGQFPLLPSLRAFSMVDDFLLPDHLAALARVSFDEGGRRGYFDRFLHVANLEGGLDPQPRANLNAELRRSGLLETVRLRGDPIASHTHFEELVSAVLAGKGGLHGAGADVFKLHTRAWNRGAVLVKNGSKDRGGLELAEAACGHPKDRQRHECIAGERSCAGWKVHRPEI
jgi:hypothetical protein